MVVGACPVKYKTGMTVQVHLWEVGARLVLHEI